MSMSRGAALVQSIALGISLFASGMAFPPGLPAQAQGSYQEQIAAFASKLETAKTAQADLNRHIVCLDWKDKGLVKQRDDLQGHLGRLRSDESILGPKVQRLEAAYKQYKLNFEAEQK